MKKTNYFMLFLIAVPLFISCSSKNFFITPEYKDKKISNATLIIPTFNEVRIVQDGRLFTADELNILQKSFLKIFNGYFEEELGNNSTFEKITHAAYKVSPEFEARSFDLNEKEKIEILFPKRPIEFVIAGSIYVLFFQDFTVAFVNEEQDTSDPAKHFSVETQPGLDATLNPQKFYAQYFTIRAKYSFYDNTTGKVVLYGSANVQEKYRLETNVENLMQRSISNFVEKIIAGTPFAN